MALNPFGFFERQQRRVTPFNELSEREQRRQENALLRISPEGTTRQQARKTLTGARRRGRIFRSGSNATPEQEVATAGYQQRSARSRLTAEQRRHAVPAVAPDVVIRDGFSEYAFGFTPDGHVIEPDGRVIEFYDPNSLASSVAANLPIQDAALLADRKAQFFADYLSAMADTEPFPGEYTKAKFEYNAYDFAQQRRIWNAASFARFNVMSYEEYRAYGKAMEARNKLIRQAGGKTVRGDWQYH